MEKRYERLISLFLSARSPVEGMGMYIHKEQGEGKPEGVAQS